jgi:lipoprotein-releasing system permease protein
MPWYLYLALKQLFPTGRRFPFFTAISVTGVALGVAVLVVVTSVMTGFEWGIRQMMVDTEGEIQVRSSGLLNDSPAVMRKIRETPGVAAATPFVAGPVMALAGNHPAFPVFHGIDLATIESVANLKRYVRVGSLDELDDDSVVLSVELAKSLGVWLGDSVEIYSLLLVQKLKNDEVLLAPRFRVVGIFQVGHQQLDSSTIYGTLRTAQQLYGLGEAVHGVDVRIQPGTSEDDVAARLNTLLPAGMRAATWEETWDDFLWALHLEKRINFFLLLIIVLIAAFSVMSSLLISVVRKTREIGLLGALGARTRDVALCFCAQAFVVGVAGTLLGLALGAALLAVRNEIVHGIARLLNREETLRQLYQFSDLPSHPLPRDIILTVVFAIVISTLGGLLPAWRAARLKPVEALRSE